MRVANINRNALSTIAITCLFIIFMCLFVKRNKEGRIKFIKNFDEFNNETKYKYAEINKKFKSYQQSMIQYEILRKIIKKLNADGVVFNPTIISDRRKFVIVIIIQVHNRIKYLVEVIDSLRHVRGITKSLLIFSHDFYDDDINNSIQAINFTSFMQIYYPYSKQLYPAGFPGEDLKFCSKDWRCVPNEGRRNATLAQVKLHWWWKVNHVFRNIDILEKYQGPVLFLEDDQYVVTDLIYTVKMLEALLMYECPDCTMISVGAERPQLHNFHLKNPFSIEEFGNTPHSMGIAFNRTVWNIIKEYGNYFCNFDDFRWTSSLRYLGRQLPGRQGKIYMFSIAGPRVFHIGRCGLSTPGTDCGISYKLDFLEKYLHLVRKGFFPKAYEVRGTRHKNSEIVELGHFSDIRDQELCNYFAKNTEFRV